MGRFLFVVPPLHGHINPTISLGQALRDRGHCVAWAGYPDPALSLLPNEADLLPVFEALPSDITQDLEGKSRGLRGAAALHFLWENFQLPLARAMVPGVERAVDLFKPDVLVVDQQALAGAVVGRRLGLRWATSATTTAEMTKPFSRLPKIREWIETSLKQLQHEFDVPAESMEKGDLRFSEQLVLVFSTPELVGWTRFPAEYAFVGPSMRSRAQREPFPWDWLDDRPRILISLGTLNAEIGSRFFSAVLEAFKEPDRQVILVAPPELVGPTPEHILVRPRVPQLALLQRVDAVVCHGGHNTVCETLARGLPLVVCPIRDDQPVIAGQVANAGAGVRVRFGRVRSQALKTAVDEVLINPAFRMAAEHIGASFRKAGGELQAARRLEALL